VKLLTGGGIVGSGTSTEEDGTVDRHRIDATTEIKRPNLSIVARRGRGRAKGTVHVRTSDGTTTAAGRTRAATTTAIVMGLAATIALKRAGIATAIEATTAIDRLAIEVAVRAPEMSGPGAV
jgi:hypothetical protein